jgi:Uma2 family endonuclease
VCEVLSPSTRSLDRRVKLVVYAREAVSHVWFIDPIAKVLEVLGRDGAGWSTQARHGYQERVRAVPFEAVEITLADIWGPTPPAGTR